jgi:hypothetical protein
VPIPTTGNFSPEDGIGLVMSGKLEALPAAIAIGAANASPTPAAMPPFTTARREKPVTGVVLITAP